MRREEKKRNRREIEGEKGIDEKKEGEGREREVFTR